MPLLYEKRGQVGILTLSRPEARNAWCAEFHAGLQEQLPRLEDVVLSLVLSKRVLERRDLDVVPPALVAEANVERHDAPVREPFGGVWEVGGRVEDDRRVRRGEVHASLAATLLIAATISSSS